MRTEFVIDGTGGTLTGHAVPSGQAIDGTDGLYGKSPSRQTGNRTGNPSAACPSRQTVDAHAHAKKMRLTRTTTAGPKNDQDR